MTNARGYVFGLSMVVALACGSASYGQVTSALDKAAQGEGNKGLSFRPTTTAGTPAFFNMTARSMVDYTDPHDPLASGSPGTVYIDTLGAGVQTSEANGSLGISGGGGHKDEELIFTFDAPVLADSVMIKLAAIEFGRLDGSQDKDDPVLFLSTAGSGSYLTILEPAIASAFTSTGDKIGWVNFASLSALPSGLMIDSFKVRETNDHTLVSAVSAPVPEPTTLAMLVMGGAASLYRRRRPA